MPKINAANVQAHVALQEAAVYEAAIRLFIERGYDNVSLGEIAAEVGLARNSLYRYFPDKAHIMIQWFRAELPLQIEQARSILSSSDPIEARVHAYIDVQLDYAATPEHTLIASLAEVVPSMSDPIRAEFMVSHRALVEPLDQALAQAGVTDRVERGIVADLITGLINAGADRESRTGRDRRARQMIESTVTSMIEQNTKATTAKEATA